MYSNGVKYEMRRVIRYCAPRRIFDWFENWIAPGRVFGEKYEIKSEEKKTVIRLLLFVRYNILYTTNSVHTIFMINGVYRFWFAITNPITFGRKNSYCVETSISHLVTRHDIQDMVVAAAVRLVRKPQSYLEQYSPATIRTAHLGI